MAVTVTSQLTTIDACEATTDWLIHNRAGSMGALAAIDATDEEVPPKEGTYCLCFDCDIENGGYYHSLAATADYSAKMIYIWAFCLNPPQLDTKTNGGIYIIARDTSANYGYWYVGGSDNYTGGWKCWAADLSRAPNANSGTAPNLANCDGVGIGFKNLAKSKASHNMFFDFMREADSGDGILVETTASSVATWADLASADDTAAIGVIRVSGGVYFVQGPITFGDTAGGDCEFDDSGQLIVFEEADVQAGHYEIVIEGATGTLNYQMGDAAGARGVSGCVFKTASPTTESYALTTTDTDVDLLKLYGCTFIGVGITSLPVTSASKEIISCGFEECGPVVVSTCTVTYCNFINSAGSAVQIASASHAVTNCNFIGCATGIEFTAAGTYALSGIQFTNCTIDVENSVNATTTDSYSESNQDTDVNLNGTNNAAAQSFDGDGNVLSRARFYLKKTLSPTGNVVAKLYAASAGVPTGAALATSNNVPTSDIGGTYALIDFEFEDEFELVLGTNNYCIAVEYTAGDGSNYVTVGVEDPGSDGGTGSLYTTSWASQTWDVCFYIFSGAIVKINASGSNPGIDASTGTPPGAIIIVNTVTLTVTCKDANNNAIGGVRVRIEKTSDGSLVSQGTASGAGVYTDASYNYVGDLAVTIKARLKGYKFFRTTGLIEDTGLAVTATMQADRIVDLP
jgi:hypothetical protein